MKHLVWTTLVLVSLLYAASIYFFGFQDHVALTLHFIRVTITVAVLIVYLPSLTSIFREVPPPRRDYLLAGIVFTWLSAFSFSALNEFGRAADVDTSIFTSAVAGLFSLLLIVGGFFHLIAPDMGKKRAKSIALIIGIIVSVCIVLIAPYFG